MTRKRATRPQRVRRAGRLRESLAFECLEPRQMLDGDPDTNFGASGVLIDSPNGLFGVVRDSANVVIADGNRIVVAATFQDNLAFQLNRYDEHGVLDATFGAAGRAGTAINSAKFNSKVYLDVMDVNGHVKYVLAGTTGSASTNPNSPVIYRFDENGTLDTSFGDAATPGRKEFGGSTQTVAGVAVDSLNRIVVSGWTTSGDAFVSRFLEFGVVDPSFDGDGSVSAPIGLTSNAQARVTGVATDASNRIIVAGNSLDGSNHFLPTMLRFGANGALDATFDGDGRWIDVDNAAGTLPAGTPPELYFGDPIETVHGPVIDANQNVLFVTESRAGFRMVRLTAAGQLDATFGSNVVDDVNGVPAAAAVDRRDGVTAWNPGALAPKALALSLDASGRILVTGSVSTFFLALARFSSDGAIDPTFNSGDLVQLNAGGVDAGTGIAVDNLGRIVVVGTDAGFFGPRPPTNVLAARFNGGTVALNLPPTASGDSYQVNKNNVLNVAAPGVLANDDDPEHQQLTAVRDQDAAHGQVVLNADGSFTYTPAAGYVGSDAFSYHATDGGRASSAPVQVSITVLNPAPVGLNDSYQVSIGSRLEVARANGVLRNDVDVDNDSLTAVLLTPPSHAEGGTFALNADGSFTYVHANGFQGTDSFIYRAFDGDAYSTPITVSIVVKTPSDQHPQQAYTATNAGPFAQYSSGGFYIDEQGLHSSPLGPPIIGTRPEDGINHLDLHIVGQRGPVLYFTKPQIGFYASDVPPRISQVLFGATATRSQDFQVGLGRGATTPIIPGPSDGIEANTIFFKYQFFEADTTIPHYTDDQLFSFTYTGDPADARTPIELHHFSASGPNAHYDLENLANFRFSNGLLNFTAASVGSDPVDFPTVYGLWSANPHEVIGLVRTLPVGDLGYSGAAPTFALGTVTVVGGEVYLNSQPIGDIRPGSAGADPQDFVEFGGSIYFTADDGVHGRELWKTSGGAPQMVRDLSPGPLGSFPPQTDGNVFFEHDDVLYFSAEDLAHGQELWRSDGTESGTYLVRDVRPGVAGSSISTFYALGGTFVFAANDGVHGTELWRSDGTQAGTRLFFDLNPGSASSSPHQFIQVNGREQFGATTAAGDRLWTLTEIGNQAPNIVTPLVDQVAVPDASFLATVGSNFATDPDLGDALAYSAQQSDGSPLPAWLSFDELTRTFHGQPVAGDAGIYSIDVTVRDRGFLSASDTFEIRVGAHASRRPVAQSGGPYTIAAGGPWYIPKDYDLANDPDTDAIVELRWDVNNDGTIDFVTPQSFFNGLYQTIPWSELGLPTTGAPYVVDVGIIPVSQHFDLLGNATLEVGDAGATTLIVLPPSDDVYVGQFFGWFMAPVPNQPYDPDGAGPATLLGYDAFPNLQMAFDAVAPGGTVHVAPEFYNFGDDIGGEGGGFGVKKADNNGKELTLEVTFGPGGDAFFFGGQVVLDSAATLRVNVQAPADPLLGPQPGTDYTVLTVASSLVLDGARLELAGAYVPAAGDSIRPVRVAPFFSQPGMTPGVQGEFANLPEGGAIALNGVNFVAHYEKPPGPFNFLESYIELTVPFVVDIVGASAGEVDEGLPVALTASTPGANAAGLSFAWYVNDVLVDDPNAVDHDGDDATFSYIPSDGGDYQVKVVVTYAGIAHEDEFTLHARDVAPIVTLIAPDTVAAAGSTVHYTFTVAPVTSDTYEYVVFPGMAGVSNVVLDHLSGEGSFDVTFSSDGKSYALINVGVKDSDSGVDPGYAPQLVVQLTPRAGTLDSSFDADGMVVATAQPATVTAVQSDGKIVVASTEAFGQSGGLAVRRYLTNGSLDKSFGIEGRFAIGGFLNAQALAVQADGKIVVGGGYSYENKVMRLNADGTLDTGFGSLGFADLSEGVFQIKAIAIQDQKIIVAGYRGANSQVVRLNNNGSIDAAFGTGGSGLAITYETGANAIAMLPGGDFIIAGFHYDLLTFAEYSALSVGIGSHFHTSADSSHVYFPMDFFIQRFHANGVPDLGFGQQSKAIIDLGGVYEIATDLAIQADGRIVIVGTTPNSVVATRYDASGAGVDSTFGNGGKVALSLGGSSNVATANLELQSNQKILVAGMEQAVNPQQAVVRLKSDGSIDNQFGNNGLAVTSFAPSSRMYDMALQHDGRIVLAGGYGGLNVSRFWGDPVSAAAPPVSLQGLGGDDDELLVEVAENAYRINGQNPTGLNGSRVINFDGGGTASETNVLALDGGDNDVIYIPDPLVRGAGVILASTGLRINYTNLRPIEFESVRTLTVALPADGSDYVLREGLVRNSPALVVAETSDGASLFPVSVRAAGRVVVASVGDGDSTLTLEAMDNAPAVRSLAIEVNIPVTVAANVDFAGGLSIDATAIRVGNGVRVATSAAPVVLRAPAITLGNSPGLVTIDGDLFVVGTMEMEIQGTTPGFQYDQLVVTGVADFSGAALTTVVGGGYVPSPGDVIELVRAGQRMIQFTGVNEGDVFPGNLTAHFTTTQSTLLALSANQPNVVGVRLSSTHWSQAFKDHVDGESVAGAGRGYVAALGDAQAIPLPWTNLNQIAVTFDRDVHRVGGGAFAPGDVSVHGVNANYAVSSVTYDSATRTMMATLTSELPVDKLLLTIAGDLVADANGHSPAADVEVRFNVLPGDVDRDGMVLGSDVGKARLRQFAVADPSAADVAYSMFADLDGSGSILGNDVGLARLRQFTELPAGEAMLVAESGMEELSVASSDEAIRRHAGWLAATAAASPIGTRAGRTPYRPLVPASSGVRSNVIASSLPPRAAVDSTTALDEIAAAASDAPKIADAVDAALSDLWNE